MSTQSNESSSKHSQCAKSLLIGIYTDIKTFTWRALTEYHKYNYSIRKFSLSVFLNLGNLLSLQSEPRSYHNLEPYKLPQQKPSSWRNPTHKLWRGPITPQCSFSYTIGAIPPQVTMKCKISQESPMELTISSKLEIYTLKFHNPNPQCSLPIPIEFIAHP